MSSQDSALPTPTFEPILLGEIRAHLPIHHKHGEIIGHLEPLIPSILDDDIASKLTQWRNLASHAFLTQFEATLSRTRKWLEKVVMQDRARLLFLIHSADRLVGQLGLRDLTIDAVELDNSLRGERGGPPDLMLLAHVTVMRWVLGVYPIQFFYCYVFEDNALILALLAKLGLQSVARYPLEKVIDTESLTHRVGKAGDPSSQGRYYLRLEITREEFNKIWPHC